MQKLKLRYEICFLDLISAQIMEAYEMLNSSLAYYQYENHIKLFVMLYFEIYFDIFGRVLEHVEMLKYLLYTRVIGVSCWLDVCSNQCFMLWPFAYLPVCMINKNTGTCKSLSTLAYFDKAVPCVRMDNN